MIDQKTSRKLLLENQKLKSEISNLYSLIEKEKDRSKVAKTRFSRILKLLETHDDIVWTIEISKGIFTYISPTIKHMLGFNRHDVIGKSIDSIMPEHSMKKIQDQTHNRLLKFIKTKENREYVDSIELYNAEKDIVSAEIYSFIELNPETDVIELVGLIRNFKYTKEKPEENNLEANSIITTSLKESERNLRAIYDNNNDIIILLDRSFNIKLINSTGKKKIERHIGIKLNRGDNILAKIPKVFAEVWQPLYEKTLAGENFIIEDIKEEQDLFEEVEFNPIWEEEKVIGLSIVSRDITKRKRFEKVQAIKLRLVEEAMRQTVNQTLQCFLDEAEKLTKSKIGFYHFIDERKQKIYLQAWSTNTLQKMCSAEGKGSEYNFKDAGVWIDCVYVRKPVIHNDYENLVHKKGLPEGHAMILRELVVPVIRSNRIVAILGVGNKENDYDETDVEIIQQLADLTWETIQRKRTEEELNIAKAKIEESEQKYRNIFDNAPLGICRTSLDGKILEANQALADMLGYASPYQVLNNINSIAEEIYVYPFEREMMLDQTMEDAVIKFESKLRRRNGEEFFGKLYIKKTKNEIGDEILEVILEDATKFKAYENLTKEVEEQKHLTETKQQFLANMSHEIRTPLNGIIGVVEFLEKTKLDKAQKEYIDTIQHSANTLLDIINEVLDLSKIEAGRLKLTKSLFNFHDYPSSIIGLFKALSRDKNIELIVNFPDSLPAFVKGDSKRIMQVVNNFLSNAIKFTEKGLITINFSIIEELNNYFRIKTEVIDTGIGISKTDQEDLFSKFSQIESAFTRNNEGTGLGLSISKKLVELMDGEIGVSSNVGEGSNFWFTFVAEKVSPEEVHRYIHKPSNREYNFEASILIVEDKKVNQLVTQKMLENVGCAVTIADNGQIATEIFEPGKFDVILMDIQMPIMDGIEATRFLRAKYDDLPPIIGLSANAMEGDAEKFVALGMDDYIPKPVRSIELYKKLEFWIE